MHEERTIRKTTRAGLAALLFAVATPLLSHGGEASTTPEDGATVQDPQDAIGIEFDGAMRVTQFEVEGPDGDVSLAGRPGNDPTERYFVEPAEPLPPGNYEVHWRGLASDGHMMSGDFRFTVED